jgi:hypothetical protein
LLSQSQNFKGLGFGDEASLDPQALVCHLRSAPVNMALLHVSFLCKEVKHLLESLLRSQWPDHNIWPLVFVVARVRRLNLTRLLFTGERAFFGNNISTALIYAGTTQSR